MSQRIQKIITELKAKNINTAALEAALAKQAELVKKLADEHALYLQKVKEIGNHQCGSSDGKFKEAVLAARAQFLKVRQAAIAVRTNYLTVVRPEIMKLRQQLKSARPAASTTAAPSSVASPSATPAQ
jgi:hypothetical protein